ncbi:MAG: DUF4340 domain-containing protein [Spirochaetales bacterium]|nr:DUF4340 domain-containing protein [Spirochaetales bacterium]
MDFKSKVLVLSSTLLGLIILLVMGSLFSAQSVRTREAETPLITGVSKIQAQKLVITAQDSLSLVKGDLGWNLLLNGEMIPTAQSKVEDFIDNILRLKRFAVVSSDPQKHASFAVDESTASRVQVFAANGKTLIDIYLGKAAVGSGQYIRLAGTDEVIQTDVQLFISTLVKDWIDLNLFSTVRHDAPISSIQIKNTGFFPDMGKTEEGADAALKIDKTPYDYTIVINESAESIYWTIQGRTGMVLSTSKVESLINNFIEFSAEDLVLASDEIISRLQNPSASIVLTTEDGLRYSLLIGSGPPTEDFRYYVRGSESTYSYMASEWNIMQLIKRPDELVEP